MGIKWDFRCKVIPKDCIAEDTMATTQPKAIEEGLDMVGKWSGTVGRRTNEGKEQTQVGISNKQQKNK